MFKGIINALKNGAAAIAQAVTTMVRWTWNGVTWIAETVVNAPLDILKGAAGIGSGVPPMPSGPRGEGEDADAAVDRVNEALDRVGRSRITAASIAGSDDYAALPAGRVVNHYALADTYERDEVDLSPLQPEQLGWLVTLTEAELTCLAGVGPDVCERHLRGEATSLRGRVSEVGPGREKEQEPEVQEDLTFADRLRRFQADKSPTPRWA